jgi:CHASE3 domain sensor protein
MWWNNFYRKNITFLANQIFEIISQARSYLITSKLAYKEVNTHREERERKERPVFSLLIDPWS